MSAISGFCEKCNKFRKRHCDGNRNTCMSILFDTIEALQQENEQLRAQVARMREALEKAREALDYWRELYGIGLEVLNWHMNGDTEPFDSFYDNSGTYEALAAIDKVIGGNEDAGKK